jgi:hypothetical protein
MESQSFQLLVMAEQNCRPNVMRPFRSVFRTSQPSQAALGTRKTRTFNLLSIASPTCFFANLPRQNRKGVGQKRPLPFTVNEDKMVAALERRGFAKGTAENAVIAVTAE